MLAAEIAIIFQFEGQPVFEISFSGSKVARWFA